MKLDVIDTVLDTHEKQGAPAVVIAAVRSLRRAETEIDDQRYQPARAAELKRARRAQAVDELAAEVTRLEQEEATQAEREHQDRSRAEHEKVVTANGHAVDPHRFTAATTPAEIVLLLRDAEAADADTLRRSWSFAEPRLRAMAMAEQRTHRIPSATSAFNSLVVWQTRMRSLAFRAPDPAQLSEVIARRQRDVRERALAVADVVGLRQAVLVAMRRAAAPEPQTSTMVVGRFFEQFGRR